MYVLFTLKGFDFFFSGSNSCLYVLRFVDFYHLFIQLPVTALTLKVTVNQNFTVYPFFSAATALHMSPILKSAFCENNIQLFPLKIIIKPGFPWTLKFFYEIMSLNF